MSGYFYYHSIGQYPGKEADLSAAMTDFARFWSAEDNTQWGALLTGRAEYLRLWSQLIDAPEGSVTATENVTVGVASLFGALPATRLKDRTVLIGADCFPSLHFLLAGLAPRLGFTLKTVPLRPGETWVRDEDLLEAWGPDVAVGMLTWISSTSSHRCDLERLSAHGRSVGSLVGIDFTQGAGLLPFSVKDTAADFAVSTSLKWLCGPPGAGCLYVKPDLIAQCLPDLRGWFSQPDPFNWDIERFSYAPDARRFDHGTPSALSALAAVPALRWHAAQDREAMVAHNRTLSDALIAAFDRLGLPLASPREANRRGGSVMIDLPEKHDPKAVVEALRQHGLIGDNRGQTLRFSPGVITKREGVDKLEEALRQFLE